MGGKPEDVASLDELLDAANRTHGYPAIVAAVADKDAILAAGATGVRKVGGEDRATVRDRFHLGSISKPMTATVVAALVEDGALGWGTAPSDLFPDPAAEIHPALRGVRLDHLLAHRSGLRPFTDDEEFLAVPPADGPPRLQRSAFARWLLRQEPASVPGAAFAYSNAGYAVAAALAEQATDQEWERLVRDRLFAPLPMAGAGFGWPALHHPDQPWGHRKSGQVSTPQPPDGPYQLGPSMAPGGDVHASVLDLAAFGRMHLRGLAGEDSLLRADTVRALHTPLGGGEYGLGWAVTEDSHNHSGSTGTFLALLYLRPDRNRVYAFATNAAASETMAASEDDAALLKGVLASLIERFE